MSALHTPGPWEQDRDGCVAMRGQRVIFDAAPDGASVEEARANRRLIAAAPELLAALNAALDEVDAAQADGVEPPAWAAAARAAIAKGVA